MMVRVFAVSCGLLFLTTIQSHAEEAGSANVQETNASWFQQYKEYFRKTTSAAERKPWKETADEVLVESRQVRWTRYLNALVHAPDWMDLGVSFRVRPEILTNPFRKAHVNLDNDDQVPLRTRARVGLDWRMFRFLFEFQDSRSLGADEKGELVSRSTVNEHEVQQLFGAVMLQNVFDTGVRTDLHFGRINMDFGRRRLIARNMFRNTTNAFDGLHS